MKISIALASYHGEKYILEQLESFANQSRIPDELIVSDDCSSDDTIKLIEQFSRNAPFEVKIFQNKTNLGYSQNFNNALLKTSGDLVFLSDQDDVWFNNKIECITKIAYSSKSLLIMNDAEITDAHLNPTGITKLSQIKDFERDESKFVMGCCAAIKRELLDFALPVDKDFPAHDTWLAWHAEFMNLKKIIPEVMQYYRRHGENESKYIGNSIYKSPKKNIFILKIKNSVFHKENYILNAELSFKIFSSHLKNIISSNKQNKLKKELLLAYKLSCTELKSIQKRIKIRKLNFRSRFFLASKFYFEGGYKKFSGFKSLLRDIIFR